MTPPFNAGDSLALRLGINKNSSPRRPRREAGRFRLRGEQTVLSVVASDRGTEASLLVFTCKLAWRVKVRGIESHCGELQQAFCRLALELSPQAAEPTIPA